MSEEEKTLEEQTETIIDAIENETEDDVREAFEINKEDGPREALGAPLIKAVGDPEPADPNMIQKHLDNFLAALCGETPVDSNVRTSTEYWLKRLGDGEGGSTKKIYQHTVSIFNAASLTTRFALGFSYFDNNAEAVENAGALHTLLLGYNRIGPLSGAIVDVVTNKHFVTSYMYKAGTDIIIYAYDVAGDRDLSYRLETLLTAAQTIHDDVVALN